MLYRAGLLIPGPGDMGHAGGRSSSGFQVRGLQRNTLSSWDVVVVYLPKMPSYSSNMSSTIWFWYTMCTAMFNVSVSGRRRVGPKTMATLWVVMRFSSPWSITLERTIESVY